MTGIKLTVDRNVCTCDWGVYKGLISKDGTYGWILTWTELTEEEGYTQVHRFGMPIKYCPLCGLMLE